MSIPFATRRATECRPRAVAIRLRSWCRALVLATGLGASVSSAAPGAGVAGMDGALASSEPVFHSITLRDARGAVLRRMMPTDTVLVDVVVADLNGFRKLRQLELTLSLGGASGTDLPTWRGASFRWTRGNVPAWTIESSNSDGWQILLALCSVDSTTNSTTPQLVRFAIVPSSVARADSTGWQVQAWAGSSTLLTSGYGMQPRIDWRALDAGGTFASGLPGDRDLPLATPSTGQIRWRLVANTPTWLTARASAFAGQSTTHRFGGGAADTTLRWLTSTPGVRTSGYLDSLVASLADSLPAFDDTTATVVRLSLRAGLPSGTPPQDYLSRLAIDASSGSGTIVSRESDLRATVLNGAAAGSAIVEVYPHRVVAGASGTALNALIGFTKGSGETGVNRARVSLPAGWSAPRVTGVATFLGIPIDFHDASTAGSAVAVLHSTRSTGTFRVTFTATAPASADSLGAPFFVYFDDTTTVFPEQVAAPGNPDFLGESGWIVAVDPAAAASVEVTPDFSQRLIGESVAFSATVRDAFGNRRFDTVTWSEAGGSGTVDASGHYVANATGTSRVIARESSLADTASVLVTDPGATTTVDLRPITTGSLLPGGSTREVAYVRIVNGSAIADTLDMLELADASHGPTTSKQRQVSWQAFDAVTPAGARLGSAFLSSDRARFENLSVAVPAGGTRYVRVLGGASTSARDGDSLGLTILEAAQIGMRSTRPVSLVPAGPPARLVVDGMAAAQVVFESRGSGPLFAGARRRAIAALRVPGNGYAADRLRRMSLQNLGSALAGADLERFELWADDGDGGLDTLLDQRLGPMSFTGDRWEISGLALDVPDSGRVVLVSADIAATAQDGRTVRLVLPTLPDVGLGMTSHNNGPIDAAVALARDEVIGAGERVMVNAVTIPAGTTHGGARNVPFGEFVLVNGYSQPRTLRTLVLTNTSVGTGTLAQRDASFSRLVLEIHSTDNVLVDVAAMPHAVSSFQNGRASFEGLGLVIPAGAEIRLQLSGDVDALRAADGDVLSASLASPQDLSFEEATTIGGKWPARSGAEWTVDGMVAAQLARVDVTGLTLAPGDGPVLALDVRVPGNGYHTDVLHGLRVENRGNADAAEIAEIRLYRDGGDGQFGGAPGDETDLGPLVHIGSQWQSAYLNETVPTDGARFFFALRVAGSTSDSSLVRLAVPVGGVDMESGNDGPRDAEVVNVEPHVLSTRPVLASLVLDPPSSTIGQQVDLRMTVRNVGSEAFEGVAPGVLEAGGTAAYQLLSGPTPGAARLLPGETATFTWTLTPMSAGDLRFSATATGTGETSMLERHTLVAHSNFHEVYTEADSLRLLTQQSMPSAVNVGQTGVVPLTLTLEHPGDGSSSDIRFRRLRVRIEQEDGSPVTPASLASAVEVREGTTVYLHRTALETSGDILDLTLTTPATLRPGNPVSLALRLDIAGSTAVPSFRLVLDDSSSFVADDAISGRPVRVRLTGQSYPVRSGLARLLSGGGALALSAPAPVRRTASGGQSGVRFAHWQVTHSSALPTSADLRLNSLYVRASALAGSLSPSPWTRWRIVADGLVVAQRNASPADTGDVRFDLVPAPVVQPGAPVTLRIEADLAPGSEGRTFAVDATRTTEWDVRDVNSGDPAPLLAPQPVLGDTMQVQSPATALSLAPVARMPAMVAAGRVRLPALDLIAHHAGGAGEADALVDSLRVSLRAPDGSALAMATYLTAVRVTRRGATLHEVLNPTGTDAVLLPGRSLGASASDTFTVELDVSGNAPAGQLELSMLAGSVRASDANSGAVLTVTPEPPAAWPFGSGTATLVAPARELRVRVQNRLNAQIPAIGSSFEPAAAMVLRHPGPSASGPIAVDHVVLRAADATGAALPLGAVAAALELRRGGTLLAQSAALTADSTVATLPLAVPIEIAANDSVVLEIAFRPRAADPATRFRVGWRADGIGVVQPTSALLAVAVVPEGGLAFPMWTDVAGFAPEGLEASVSNFPNPFAAGRDATTFAWNMPVPGRATLRIWTSRGHLVTTLLEDASIGAGLRQSERWDGRNGRGDVVTNGVYVAELVVTMDDGRRERVLRKVAVVR